MPVNIVDGVRWNAAFAFLDPVRGQRPPDRRRGRTVRRILFDGTAPSGSRSPGLRRDQLIRAGRVVVAAGAYHSPALLLRSGVGPAGELQRSASSPVADLPGVGQHLLDHACVQLNFHGKDGLLAELAGTRGTRTSRPSAGPGRRGATTGRTTSTSSWWPAPTAATPACRRSASTAGRCGPGPRAGSGCAEPTRPAPVIDHRYGTDPDGHDRAVLAESLDLLGR